MIGVPALVIHGDDDNVAPLDMCGRRSAELLCDAAPTSAIRRWRSWVHGWARDGTKPSAYGTERREVAGYRAAADRDAVGRELKGDARCRPLVGPAHLLDPGHGRRVQGARLSVWRRRSVEEAEFSVAAIAVDPFRRGIARDAHLCGDVSDGAHATTFDKSAATLWREWRVAVSHDFSVNGAGQAPPEVGSGPPCGGGQAVRRAPPSVSRTVPVMLGLVASRTIASAMSAAVAMRLVGSPAAACLKNAARVSASSPSHHGVST